MGVLVTGSISKPRIFISTSIGTPRKTKPLTAENAEHTSSYAEKTLASIYLTAAHLTDTHPPPSHPPGCLGRQSLHALGHSCPIGNCGPRAPQSSRSCSVRYGPSTAQGLALSFNHFFHFLAKMFLVSSFLDFTL